MASNQQFCLRWNNHQSTLISVFDHLLESGTLVDCTLAAEGQFLKAHKVVLSACSPYLEVLLSQHYEKHPILILKDVRFHELKSMLDYMYRGEVNISQEQLGAFLKAAESLQIKGLTDCGTLSENRDLEQSSEMENSLRVGEFNQIDRSLSSNILKRPDLRKQIPVQTRPRSPLVGLPLNFMVNSDHRKGNKYAFPQEVNSGISSIVSKREGSLSPSSKRKRPCPSSFLPQSEDSNIPLLVEHNIDQNHVQKNEKNKDTSLVSQNSVNTVPKTAYVVDSKKVTESESVVSSEVVKREVKTEKLEFADEIQNEDSVEDLTVDEEEEEMDEMDLSRPGPSTASNSLVAGVPWHIAGEGNSDEGLLAAQQDSQDTVSRSLECAKCHKTYSSPHTLRRHVRLECGQEPRFFCPYCPHRTKQRYNLMLHIGRTHREMVQSEGRNKAMMNLVLSIVKTAESHIPVLPHCDYIRTVIVVNLPSMPVPAVLCELPIKEI